MIYQLTITVRGTLINWYFDEAEGQEARVHADVAGCTFLYGRAGPTSVPFGQLDTPADFLDWLSRTRQGA